MIVSFGFEMNMVDECVYHKFDGGKHIFLVLYVDDILLATNDIGLLHETKRSLSNNFKMVDLGEASFLLWIKIHWNRSRVLLNYHKRVISIRYLKDLACKVVNQLTPLSLNETNLVSVNALKVIWKFRQLRGLLTHQL